MAVDPELTVSSSIHSAPKAYAILVGSGISASAGIPTAWEVTRELLLRLASMRREDTPEDPFAWYAELSGAHTDYSSLLRELAPSPADRRHLLEPFFEANEEDRAAERKQPTSAHRAIAQLVANGHIQIVLTTNFDRLFERAFEEAGLSPVVISTPAAASGSIPLARGKPTLLKVHGDYMRPDFRNTVDELGRYDRRLSRMLSEIFDNYGLIVCGWSASWDIALHDSILNAPGRRYSTFWALRGEPSPEAQQLITHRDAQVIPIEDADSFFTSIAEKVTILRERSDADEMSTEMAVAQLKLLLPNPLSRIRLHDLIVREAKNTRQRVGLESFPIAIPPAPTADSLSHRSSDYALATGRLMSILLNLGYFGESAEHDKLCVQAVMTQITGEQAGSGLSAHIQMQKLPAVLLMYATLIGAMLAERPSPFGAFADIEVATSLRRVPLIVEYNPTTALPRVLTQTGPGLPHTPWSDWFHKVVLPLAGDLALNDEVFSRAFDRMEYVLALMYWSYHNGWAPIGRHAWRWPRHEQDDLPSSVTQFTTELLSHGLFNGERQRLDEAVAGYEAWMRESGIRWP